MATPDDFKKVLAEVGEANGHLESTTVIGVMLIVELRRIADSLHGIEYDGLNVDVNS